MDKRRKTDEVTSWLTSARRKRAGEGGGDVLDWMGVRNEEKSSEKSFSEVFVEGLESPGERLKKQVEAGKKSPGRPVIVRGDLETLVKMLQETVEVADAAARGVRRGEDKKKTTFAELDERRKIGRNMDDFRLLVNEAMDDPGMTTDQKLAKVQSLAGELAQRLKTEVKTKQVTRKPDARRDVNDLQSLLDKIARDPEITAGQKRSLEQALSLVEKLARQLKK